MHPQPVSLVNPTSSFAPAGAGLPAWLLRPMLLLSPLIMLDHAFETTATAAVDVEGATVRGIPGNPERYVSWMRE